MLHFENELSFNQQSKFLLNGSLKLIGVNQAQENKTEGEADSLFYNASTSSVLA